MYKNNPNDYANDLLWIKTKEGRLQKLAYNNTQKKIYKIIQQERQKGKPVRLIILKARQEGVSTLIESLFFHNTVMNNNVNSLMLAHDLDSSNYIFGMAQLFYEELKWNKPTTKYSNRKELDFEGLRSKILVDTANNLKAGKGGTFQNIHFSEVAEYRDAETLMTSALQSVPDIPNSMVVMESTGRGVGGYFHDLYYKAKRGEVDYIPIFIAWFEHEEYRRKPEAGFTLTKEEVILQQKYKLNDEQLAWRRWAIKNKCNGDVALFGQEYPAEDYEAFITTGNPVFDVPKLRDWFHAAKPPVFTGDIVIENGTIKLLKNERGGLKIWELPKPSGQYVIGADVAEGGDLGDYSAASVKDRKTWKQVATFKGKIDVDLYSQVLDRLGKFYHLAKLAVEVNNQGIAVLSYLQKNIHYGNLYYREILDELTNKVTKKFGWRTDIKSKPIMIADQTRAIREGLTQLVSRDCIEEHMTYVTEPDGATNAQQGCFDDLVIADSIATQMLIKYPYRTKKRWKLPMVEQGVVGY